MNPTSASLATLARDAGYEILSLERLRPNRWLLSLRTPAGEILLALAQARPLLVAADVHDLAELLRLRRIPSGILLALDGHFSPEAMAAVKELRHPRVQPCRTLPPAPPAPGAAPGAFETA